MHSFVVVVDINGILMGLMSGDKDARIGLRWSETVS